MNHERLEILKMKLEILKLKADDYNWQCHIPKDVKAGLEKILKEIEEQPPTKEE